MQFLLLKRNKNSNFERSANETATKLASKYAFIYRRLCAWRSLGSSYQPAVDRGRRPFLIIHRRWQRRNRRNRDWSKWFPRTEQGTRSRAASQTGEKASGRKREREKGRKRERGAKNEVKFIRVQTDVNLFKLRDFGNGWERRGWWGLLRCDGSGSICFITARDKGWAWSALAREKDSILREIKKSTGLSLV